MNTEFVLPNRSYSSDSIQFFDCYNSNSSKNNNNNSSSRLNNSDSRLVDDVNLGLCDLKDMMLFQQQQQQRNESMPCSSTKLSSMDMHHHPIKLTNDNVTHTKKVLRSRSNNYYMTQQEAKKRELSLTLKEQLFGNPKNKKNTVTTTTFTTTTTSAVTTTTATTKTTGTTKNVRFFQKNDDNAHVKEEWIPVEYEEEKSIHIEKKPSFSIEKEGRRRVTDFWMRRDRRRGDRIASRLAKTFVEEEHEETTNGLVQKLQTVRENHYKNKKNTKEEQEQQEQVLQEWVESEGRGLESQLLLLNNMTSTTSKEEAAEWARKMAMADAVVARLYQQE